MFGYSNEYQAHYYDFQAGYWADEDPEKCRCRGSGWALSEVDTWHRCRFHGKDAAHPEDYRDEEEMQEPNPAFSMCPDHWGWTQCSDSDDIPF